MTEKKPRGTAMTPQERSEAARKGGLAASKDLERMRENGRKGGLKTSQDRAHMSAIGRKGGQTAKPTPPQIMQGGPEDSPLPSGSSKSSETKQ